MANHRDDRPLSELMTGLVADISGLFRKEIDLAKTEASETLNRATGGLETLLVGLIFAIGAIGVLLSAVVQGLAAYFATRGITEPNAEALSAAVVGVVVGLLSWAMISRGLSTMKGSSLKLDRTTASLQRDVDVFKEQVR
ncbi:MULTISPECIES: phage holin family protein [unclassified Sinorhizobium]|uniref:phage holin family protein n=1 Tax=unclassified Sinorhizobium TaxID=2613772 RepID=UPI0024C2A119|nr:MULTISPECIES: phage holin family protein [unclassified Sinorhizobium]MDK1377357.1 phage holin family protein [Sinorhizobium sp. 6-70]MDK1478847.1 phage holin family protein [Sinorhizobium sp. 6-117]